MTAPDDSAAPQYLNSIDTDTAHLLPPDDPNLATRDEGAGPADHESLIGDPIDDATTATTDATTATVEDDLDPDDDGTGA